MRELSLIPTLRINPGESDNITRKTHLNIKIRTEIHARKMKLISEAITLNCYH